MRVGKIPKIKSIRHLYTDFTRCKSSKNFVLRKESAVAFNVDALPQINGDEYAKFIVDGETLVIKNNGEVISKNGERSSQFDVNNIFCTKVYIGGREYLYVSDGVKSAFVHPTLETIIPNYASTVATFHKGRLYFYENCIFKSSAPLSPEIVDEGLSVDFLPYNNYGKALYAVDFCGFVYVVSEGGIFKFTEISDRRISVYNVVKFAVKIKEGSACLIGKHIYFLTDDAVFKLSGNTVDLLDEPIKKGYFLKGAICAGFGESYFIKNESGEVIAFCNGIYPFANLFGVEVNRCGVFRLALEEVFNSYEVKIVLPRGFTSLKKIRCDVKGAGTLEVFSKGNSKKYSLNPGENLLKIGVYCDEFVVKITSHDNEQIIYSLEYEY